ncbi:hypothetical protein NA57DRAFT_57865 [Rhizodiscina lignyota]|uniref:Uncharacterized protein n=1 Tax=Rhizodiscina lignyota TaxID=1504668 RepID=A0A9P4M8Y4_9PEZI|nr:hypothetical protein NA57DRAFT_57865 [Rhizodiscina lignyota]
MITPASFLFLLAIPLSAAILIWLTRGASAKLQRKRISQLGAINEKEILEDPYEAIEPLADLDWKTTEPIKIRPFKPKYHLTMALETCSLADLVLVDKTYLSRIHIRRDCHVHHEPEVVQCNPAGVPAVNEFYEWMTTTYLPKRFPTMYQLSNHVVDEKAPTTPQVLRNLVTGEDIPVQPPNDPKAALKTLSSHVDCDFIFLLPTPSTMEPPSYPGPSFHPASYQSSSGTSTPVDSTQDQPRYHLHAFMGTFPSGFNWLEKFSKPLASIHDPVPGYASKLEKSMDRFFATLPPGKIVQRRNWAVTTNRELFLVKGNHGDAIASSSAPVTVAETLEQQGGKDDEVNLKDTVLRAERQTLHRLPKTGALVFGFKTYQYELDDVKAEGSGEDLAQAIEGLWLGSVSKMVVYKKGDVWGKKVCEYLRS